MIGIFDSGLGGLTVARAIRQELPGYDFTYFGDTARTPYGAKSAATVARYAMEDTAFLFNQGARIIVIACNSASSVATDEITRFCSSPVFEVITPAAILAGQLSRNAIIGVIGTRATISSGIYETRIHKLHPEATVYSQPCPLLVPLVEEGWMNKPETAMIIKKYLHPLKTRHIDTLILGCTHYPILKQTIQNKIGKKVTIIDSSLAVARQIKTFLADHPRIDAKLSQKGTSRFFVSDITPQFQKTARLILKQDITLEHVLLE